jgi:uncharacterized membrane protein
LQRSTRVCHPAAAWPKQGRRTHEKGSAIVDTVLTEWLSLIIRWLHVVAGIAWIGSSFYFIHLDLSLKSRADQPQGVHGDAWQVHGGGFYHMVKYLVAPARMPDELTWFKWEAYTTWLSGFALLVVVYYLGAELYLIDKSVLDLTATRRCAARRSAGTRWRWRSWATSFWSASPMPSPMCSAGAAPLPRSVR